MTLNFNKNISFFSLFFLFCIIIVLIKFFLIQDTNVSDNYHLHQILKNDSIGKSNNTKEKDIISSDFCKFKINPKDFEIIQTYIFSNNYYDKLSIINKITNEEQKIIEKIKNKWNFVLETKIKREKNINDLDIKINNLIKKQELIQSQIEVLENQFFSNPNSLKGKEKLLHQKKINDLKEQYCFNQNRYQKFKQIKFNFVENCNKIIENQKHKLKIELYSFYELM
ncbi:hypothetical protein [Candidatus Phytoplasma bonamiae]|uniref:Effector n=1 Tax=Candidatus Phytoplasma bonamiae TaxID=2982626 RepID=A0ABT9D3W8_9MOLU|nr:hypothetical protein ['Bonamia sp.' little leaf phytoplasma]MDO8064118.1 hypothetical protein ['Bonamia sp.' little leaf phytoplasma]MDV3174816.1 hypothetical protein ['Bonamia sp.' little leaf phytoplasma]